MKRAYRLGPAPLAPDLRPALLSAFDAVARVQGRRRRSANALRVALVLIALVQLAVVIPTLLFGHDREAPVHVAHEMGSFELAVALGFLAAAARPSRAQGMAWLTAAASAVLVMTAAIDLSTSATTITDEAPHLLVILGTVFLVALGRVTTGPSPHRASTSGPDRPSLRPLLSRTRRTLPVVPARPHTPPKPAAHRPAARAAAC